MHILVTRPEADARAMTERLVAAGHRVTIEPLLRIEPVPSIALPLAGTQSLIATSRNALRALIQSPQLTEARRLPIIVVGPGTAKEAEALGFTDIIAGPGTASELVAVIHSRFEQADGRLLILAGEVLAFDLEGPLKAAGYGTEKLVVYRSTAASELSAATATELRNSIDAVILMSPRTAATYAGLVLSHGLEAASQHIVHCCISEATKARLTPLKSVPCEVSVQPNLEEMLALIGRVAAKSAPRS